MALATYADLQTAVTNWLARSDLTAFIPDFVTVFEASANRRLRTRQMEISTSLTTSGGSVSLPADYLEWRSLTWLGSTHVDVQYVHPSVFESYYPSGSVDIPRFFTIEGSTLKTIPLDDTTPLQLDYYQKITALSSSVNWLFSGHPDVYLFGTLAESHGFIKDESRLALYKARRDEGFEEIERLDHRASGPASIRTVGPII